MNRPRTVGLPLVAVTVAFAVAPARRKIVEWFTRINGTWVGIAEMPTSDRVERPLGDGR